jgi:hypothetical protein
LVVISDQQSAVRQSAVGSRHSANVVELQEQQQVQVPRPSTRVKNALPFDCPFGFAQGFAVRAQAKQGLGALRLRRERDDRFASFREL